MNQKKIEKLKKQEKLGKRNGGRKKLLYFIATTHKGQGTDDRDDDMQKNMKIFSMQKNDVTTKIHLLCRYYKNKL